MPPIYDQTTLVLDSAAARSSEREHNPDHKDRLLIDTRSITPRELSPALPPFLDELWNNTRRTRLLGPIRSNNTVASPISRLIG